MRNADKRINNTMEDIMQLLLILAFALVGCGMDVMYTDAVIVNKRSFNGKEFIAKEFEPYTQQFEELWGRKLKNISMVFGDTCDPDDSTCVLGYCQFFENKRVVVIDRKMWFSANETMQKLLIYHELGHCALRRGHKDGVSNRDNMINVPDSIMNSYLSWSMGAAYQKDPNYYEQELFGRFKK